MVPIRRVNIIEEIEKNCGFIEIPKKHPLMGSINSTIDFIIECSSQPQRAKQLISSDSDYLGFSDVGGEEPSIISTYGGLTTLFWAEHGLGIEDAVARLLAKQGSDAFLRIARFTAKSFGSSTDGIYSAFRSKSSDSEIDLEATHRGLGILYLLSDAFGAKQALPEFKRIAGDQAFLEIYMFVKDCFVGGDETGAYVTGTGKALSLVRYGPTQRPDIGAYRPYPTKDALNIHSTYHALDTLRLVAPLIGDQGIALGEEVRDNTQFIKAFLKLFRVRFAHLPGMEQDMLSTNEVTKIVEALFWFNHPDKIGDKVALEKFRSEFYDPEKMVDFVMRCYDPKVGGFAWYAPPH